MDHYPGGFREDREVQPLPLKALDIRPDNGINSDDLPCMLKIGPASVAASRGCRPSGDLKHVSASDTMPISDDVAVRANDESGPAAQNPRLSAYS